MVLRVASLPIYETACRKAVADYSTHPDGIGRRLASDATLNKQPALDEAGFLISLPIRRGHSIGGEMKSTQVLAVVVMVSAVFLNSCQEDSPREIADKF